MGMVTGQSPIQPPKGSNQLRDQTKETVSATNWKPERTGSAFRPVMLPSTLPITLGS